jgi:hypothetical protein
MGILDEAIRDHLELKRRGGTQEQDLMRLEDEAFGPPTRPGDPEPGSEATSEAPQALKTEDDAPVPESAPISESAPAPESKPAQEAAPAADGLEGNGDTGVGGVFHDFAAEEGLVGPSGDAAAVEQEFKVEEAPAEPVTGSDAVQEQVREPEPPTPPEPEPPAPAEPEASEQPPATPVPQSLDDTQPHDMEAELGSVEAEPQREPDAADEVDDDLELHVEEEEIEIVEEDIEIVEEEGTDDSPEELSADDVLEETPDFLQDTPEHDRLWFEQKPPKDFDFDE